MNVSFGYCGPSDGIAASPALACKVEPSGDVIGRTNMNRKGNRGQPRSIVWGNCSKRNLEWGNFDRSELCREVVFGGDADGGEGKGDYVEVADAPATNDLPGVKPKVVVVVGLYANYCARIKTDTTIES